jgi:glycogen operon protein
MNLHLVPGKSWPLGASCHDGGVNFALFSGHATRVELCLFPAGEEIRFALEPDGAGVWRGFVAGAQTGLLYGYRVYGPWLPQHGHRFNPRRLLLDPYARIVEGELADHPLHYDFCAQDPHEAQSQDNAALALKARVASEPFDWQGDTPPARPWSDTVIYEAHVRGLTRQHPAVPPDLRGSYAALAHPAVITHLQKLGVTAIELLPVAMHLDEPRLQALGLTNYWGYNPVAPFALEPAYWSGRAGTTPLSEFREAVRALHAAGIEVILDVVFNHTAELDVQGPTFSLRGIDNASYYVLNGGEYENWAGCGNVLNLAHPRVLQYVMDCLRYWVQECHVDGFRFDLATIVGRRQGQFDTGAAIFAAIGQDPALQQCKFIAEPWDIGLGGYQLGEFPPGWGEWNDQFRDTMRSFWLHSGVNRALFARRFAASSDLFAHSGRRPTDSINFITAHDGFTLADLTTFNHKRNWANKEQNRDGHNQEHSWNCGAEGPSADAHVLLLRQRARKALLATLLLSQGTPMLLAGDELGHSQEGNNNAYCQDNALTWLDWETDGSLADYVGELIRVRREIPALQSGQWWNGMAGDEGVADVCWLNPSGTVLEAHDWDDPAARALMIRLSGHWLVLVNGTAHQLHFQLPAGNWRLRLASTEDTGAHGFSGEFAVGARSVTILQMVQAISPDSPGLLDNRA